MHQRIVRAALLPAFALTLVACGSPSAVAPSAPTPAEATAPPVTATVPPASPTAAATATRAPASPTAAATTSVPPASPTVAATATRAPASPTARPATAAPAVTPALTAESVATAVPAPSAPAASGAAASPHVQQAIADLAARLGVEPGAISILRAEELDWPDGSLGCPQEGMGYTQALVNGYFVQLGAGGQTYNYHGRAGGEPFLCTSKDEQLPEDVAPGLRGGGGGDT
ncbi:MAG TPA: hypothetical protein PKD53_16955 [Chloroflexaceae bacterium]|nr:hypothetical protein [Chloroflexaceae bacterium]